MIIVIYIKLIFIQLFIQHREQPSPTVVREELQDF